MPSDLQSLFRNHFGARVFFDTPVAPLVAYRVGGPADILAFPKDEADLTFLADAARQHHLPITVIGEGTNLLVKDEGIRGITVSLRDAFRDIELLPLASPTEEYIEVRCGGGVKKPDLLQWAVDRGYTGLEFSSGVPGTFGGGVFMNAGTKYGCYGDILRELRLFHFDRGATQFLTEKQQFGYRHQNALGGGLVLWGRLVLKPGNKEAIAAEVQRIIEERAAKQPLDYPSCGSTFKNPEGHSAGRLIEKAGLKGLSVGGAEISLKHANFILNKGNAQAEDILSLIRTVQAEVEKKFGVRLETEVIVVGGK